MGKSLRGFEWESLENKHVRGMSTSTERSKDRRKARSQNSSLFTNRTPKEERLFSCFLIFKTRNLHFFTEPPGLEK